MFKDEEEAAMAGGSPEGVKGERCAQGDRGPEALFRVIQELELGL